LPLQGRSEGVGRAPKFRLSSRRTGPIDIEVVAVYREVESGRVDERPSSRR